MALLKFLKGNYSSLSTHAITEGQILICGDTGEMFVDVAADKRVKIGDFIIVPTLEALEALDATAVPTSRLYYVEDGNILARSNGTGWIQINKQKTLAELGGVSSTTYATDKAALVKADTDNATAISDLKTLVGSIPEGATATTVVGYIDEKTANITSGSTVSALAERVTTAEGKLDTLTGADTVEGSVAKALKDAKAYTDDKDTAMNTRMGAVEDSITTLTGEEGVAGSVKAIAKSYADGKDAAIAEAKAAADAAQADVDALQGTIDSAVEAATADLDYTATGMAKSKTIKSLTQVDGKIAAEFEDIEVAQYQVTGLSTALSDLSTAIDTEKSRAEGIEGDLRTDVDAIKADYLKTADKTALQNAIDTEKGRLDTFLASAEVGEAAVDTLKEIQDYIDTHGEAAAALTTKVGALETTVGKAVEGENPATGLVKDVADNAAAIAAEKSRAEGVEATLAQADTDNLAAAKKYADDKIIELGIGDYAKQADLDTHTGNSDIHITAAERTKWNTAEGKAHTHANKALLDTYTQTDEDLADAVAKKHEHANKTVLDGITAEKVSTWDSAQANAADALASAKTELEGKITTAQTAAEGKVTGLANGAVKANTDAIAVINGTDEGSISKALSDAKAYTDALANGQVTTNKNDIVSLLEQITWGSF